MVLSGEASLNGHDFLWIVPKDSFKWWGMFLFNGPAVEAAEDVALTVGLVSSLLSVSLSAIVAPRQVHGTDILAGVLQGFPVRSDADGILLMNTTMVGMLRFADCVPVLLGDPSMDWVMGIHSGYAGTAHGICSKGLDMVQNKIACRLDGVRGWIGPSVCGQCYSRNFNDTLTQEGIKSIPMDYWELRGETVCFDLKGAVSAQLCGPLKLSNLLVHQACTVEDHRFRSHRRDRTPHRMILLFGLGYPPVDFPFA